MRATANLAAIARDRGCNVSRASRPRIVGKMPATRESSSNWRRHAQLPFEESRGRVSGCLRGVRLARCGYQRGERERPDTKRGPSISEERLLSQRFTQSVSRFTRPASRHCPLSAGIPKAITAPLESGGTPRLRGNRKNGRTPRFRA